MIGIRHTLAQVFIFSVFVPFVLFGLFVDHLGRCWRKRKVPPARDPKCVAITGASRGVGAELALLYARVPGVQQLHLFGREPALLSTVKEACQESGVSCFTYSIDIGDTEAMAKALVSIDALMPIDVLIANAGISFGPKSDVSEEEGARTTFRTNVDGMFNTIFPVLERMRSRQRGQIALMSSLATFPLSEPHSGAYTASKAAIRVYGECKGTPAL